jgi:hypothetical protein
VTRLTFRDSYSDTRDCTTCSCTNSPTGACEATTFLYSGGGCSNFLTTLQHGSCVNTGKPSAVITSVNRNGSCPANGGSPTGTVTEVGTKTVCCN